MLPNFSFGGVKIIAFRHTLSFVFDSVYILWNCILHYYNLKSIYFSYYSNERYIVTMSSESNST